MMRDQDGHEVLSVAEMGRCDAAAIAGGVPGAVLMDNAGTAVARAIQGRYAPRPTVVLCGPGNNGGDGYVVARRLAATGWPVTVAALVPPASLKGDARHHARLWTGKTMALSPRALDGAALVVDALFGAGLSRPLEGRVRTLVEALGARALPVVAVDVPSGVEGDSGAVLGAAPAATLSVTFFRKKPAHLLLPGRLRCGEVVVADIGIPGSVLGRVRPRLVENGPWHWHLPRPAPDGHKYARGHAVVWGGARMTGAARLAARAALRAGAGLVTILCPSEAAPTYRADWASLLVETADGAAEFGHALDDPRRNAVLIGPGAGADADTRVRALAALARGKCTVLDADALNAFAGQGAVLFGAIQSACLLTPHEGEYRRIFAHEGDKVARTRAAAAESGAAVLLKGADTVIAAPDGRAAINANAPRDLATAGAGDVLAGLATGLMAQGMAAYEAGCAAAWLHGAAASAFGPGLVADDLPDALPAVLRALASGTE